MHFEAFLRVKIFVCKELKICSQVKILPCRNFWNEVGRWEEGEGEEEQKKEEEQVEDDGAFS